MIESDQGSHFMGSKFKRWAEIFNIIWNCHRAYNPQIGGNIDRFNRLIKTKILQDNNNKKVVKCPRHCSL